MAAAAAVGARSLPGGACRKRQFRPSTCAPRPPSPGASRHVHLVQRGPTSGRGSGPRSERQQAAAAGECLVGLCRLRTPHKPT